MNKDCEGNDEMCKQVGPNYRLAFKLLTEINLQKVCFYGGIIHAIIGILVTFYTFQVFWKSM